MNDPDLVRQTDAALVLAYTAGDMSALAAIYDRYADRLFDVAAAMMRDRHEAADVMQDTFLVAAERMSQLRDPERLKPWLFSIARHEIYRRTKKRSRTIATDFGAPGVADVAAAVDPTAEGESVAYAELAELVRSAASGLDERDQMVLELSVRQGLQGADLAAALGMSAEQSYTVVHRTRERVERSLGALVVARSGRKDCPELAEILRSWDGTFSILIRKRVARHVENCSTCERTKRKVAPLVLLGDAAALAAPPDLRDVVLAKAAVGGGTPNRSNDYDFGNEGGFPRAIASTARKVGVGLGIVAAALLVSIGGAVAVSRLTTPDRVQLQSATATTDSVVALPTSSSTAPPTPTDAIATSTTTAVTDTITDSTVPDTTLDASTTAPATGTIDATTIDPTATTSAPVVTITRVPLATVAPTTTRPGRTTVPTTATPTTAATTTAPPTTAPPTTAPPTTAPPTTVPPGRLQASSGTIDLGATNSAGSVTLTNIGGQTVSYALGSGAVTPFAVTGGGSGTLAPGQSATVTITLARRGLAEGTYTRAMSFVANGVTTTVQLNARVEIPPTVRIATPARDGSVCQATPPFVGAVATDSSGIGGVALSWIAPNGDAGSTPMTLSAASGQWTGSIRLERSAGIWNYTVTATDTRGNSAAASSTFSVVDCIG